MTPEKNRSKSQKYYYKHKEEVKKQRAEYYQRTKDKRLAYQANYNLARKGISDFIKTAPKYLESNRNIAVYSTTDELSKIKCFKDSGFYYKDGEIFNVKNKLCKGSILRLFNSIYNMAISKNHFAWYCIYGEICKGQIQHIDKDNKNCKKDNMKIRLDYCNGFKSGDLHISKTMVLRQFKTTNYVNNATLTQELIVSLGKGKLTKKAEEMFLLIGNNLIKKFRYFSADDKYDCLMHGLMMAYQNWVNFNPIKYENGFAYITEIIKRGIAFGLSILQDKNVYDNYIPKKISINNWY